MLKTKQLLLALLINVGASGLALASTQQTMIHAVKGDATAQYTLANMYLHGLGGFPKDSSKAAKWLSESAKQNNANAMLEIGEMLLQGNGVNQNIARGLAYIEKAAELKNPQALISLAKIYDKGEIVEYNPVKTVELLKLSADRGDFASQGLLGHYLTVGETKDIPKAIHYLTMAANHGDAGAQLTLGKLYLSGTEVAKNTAQALIWLQRAVKQNKPEAMYYLASMYENSNGVKMDFDKAKDLYRLAANKGHSDSLDSYKRLLKRDMKTYK